jgi:hypothetical protein
LRLLRVERQGVDIQHIFHAGHILTAHARNAPLLLQPRLDGFFSDISAPVVTLDSADIIAVKND